MLRRLVPFTLLLTLAGCQLAPAPTPTPLANLARPTHVPEAAKPTSTQPSLSGATVVPGVPTVTPQALQPLPTLPGATAAPALVPTLPALAPPGADPAAGVVPAGFVRPDSCATLASVQRLPGLRLGGEVRLTDDIPAQIARSAQIGARWVSFPVSWAAIEAQRGSPQLALLDATVEVIRQSGQQPLLIVRDTPAWAAGADLLPKQPADLATFLGLLAARYQGKVAAYQVFELPNVAASGRPAAKPERYAEALLAASAAIRAADPCALILGGGLLPSRSKDAASSLDDLVYMQKLLSYNKGAAKAAYDAWAVPLLTGDTPPGEHSKKQEERHRRFTYLERLRNELVFQGEADKQIWVSLGWPLAPGGPEAAGVKPDDQAKFMDNALKRIAERHPWVATVLVRGLSARPPSAGEADYRIVRDDGTPLPAFKRLAQARPGVAQPDPRGGFSGPADLGLLWAYRRVIDPAPGAALGPDGALHIASSGQWAYAIDGNGAFQWSYRLGGQQGISGLTVDRNGITYLGSDKNLLVAVAADSTTRWDLLLPEPVKRPVAVAAGLVYVPLASSLAAVDATSGALRWVAPLGGEPGRAGIAADGTAFVGTTDGVLHAIGIDGTQRWLFNTGRWVRGAPLVLDDGQVVAASDGGSVFALDGSTGAQRWRFDGAGALTTRPALAADGVIYVPSSEGKLYALGPDGTLRWQADLPGPAALAASSNKDGTILVSAGRSLVSLDATGGLRWRFDAKARLISAPQLTADGIAIVADEQGTVYGLGPLALHDRLGWEK